MYKQWSYIQAVVVYKKRVTKKRESITPSLSITLYCG